MPANRRASPAIVPAVSMEEMDVYADAAHNQAEWTMAVQSVALACQNLLLAAHHVGLGACWLCAPLFVPPLYARCLSCRAIGSRRPSLPWAILRKKRRKNAFPWRTALCGDECVSLENKKS